MFCLLVLASCQKPEDLAPGKDISYSESDFVDNEIINPSTNKNGDRKSNLKVVVRQVNNAENTYRLVLKVDSVSVDLNGDGVDELLPLGENAVVEAGLSLPNPNNPDDNLVVFGQSNLTFRKQNENGYYVFVSDAFTSDFDFDYELVEVSYRIGRWKFDDDASQDPSYTKIVGSGQFFILPNGKTIEQAPKVTNFKAKGPGRAGAGASAVFGSMRLTTFDDPIGQVSSVRLFALVIGINTTKEETKVPLVADFKPIGTSSTIGVTIWANEQCIGNYDDKQTPPVWKCEDELLRPYTSFAVLLASCRLGDKTGAEIATQTIPFYTVTVE